MDVQRSTRSQRAVRNLGPVSWVVIAVSATAHVVLSSTDSASHSVLIWSMTLFFLVILIRNAVAIRAFPERRNALVLLLIALALWSVGAMLVNATKSSDLTHFPAPGEFFFLAAYLSMAGFLVLDAARRSARGVNAWLDLLVICGGTACLASSLVLVPASTSFGKTGLALLLALLYPLIDLTLAVIVVAQVVLRARTDARHATMLCLGFLCLAYADAQFVINSSSNDYNFSAVADVAWGAAFALIVSSACRQGTTALRAVPRTQGPAILLIASTIALVVLIFRSQHGIGPYLVAPAVITLLAAGLRLVRAVREANSAAEAFALSRTDDLTLLPNRRAARTRLDEDIAAKTSVALLLLDLDAFKEINDTLGHAAGDIVLQMTALQIGETLPADVLLARVGGDEYAIVVNNCDELSLFETANRVIDALSQPLLVDGIEIAPSGSIGIAVHAESDAGSTELFRRADVAMYQAKLTGQRAVLYDPHNDDFSRTRLQLAEELRKGISDGQLRLHYQPQIAAATQQVCGVEALLRWEHPTQGRLGPLSFLPAARRAGLMLMLSEEVARMAAVDVHRWRLAGLDMRVAINCAPPELLSGLFVPRLYDVLAAHGVSTRQIVVELTEDSFVAEPERAREIISDMRDRGLQIGIDDYGTGYSSLSYLRDLPVHELKIDRSFVASMQSDPRSHMIVASTLQMARALGLRTVAEGVEDAPTAADLVALGVDVLQGYHLSRPMPAEEIEGWVRNWKSIADLSDNGPSPEPVSERASLPARDAKRSSRVLGARRTGPIEDF
jgi:diguanylate cyclase (GGDEF)-like protein